MALTFPSNPTLNQVYSTGSLSWTWNGKSWNNGTSILAISNLVSSSVQFTNGNTNAFDTTSNITVGQITASFAKISGSIFGTASFATNALSASYAPNIYVLPSNVVSSSAQHANGGGVAFDTNNNITVGQITASFAKITNLTVEYVTSSVMVITGSNKFGDASNDKQEFTGSVSISGSLSVTGALNTSGTITSTATGDILSSIAATTTEKFSRLNNTGGATKWGTESSVGGTIFIGTTAYASVFGSALNNPVQIASNNSVVATVSSTGLAVTGTLSATGNTITFGTDNFTLTDTYFGYVGNSYRVLRVGTNASQRSVALCVDPSTITGGNFSGTGQILIANNSVLAPDSAGTNWMGVIRATGGNVVIGPVLTSGELVGGVTGTMTMSSTGLAVTGALSSTGILSGPGFRASKTTATSGLVKIQDEGANVYNVIGSRNNADNAALPLNFQATNFDFNGAVAVTGALSATGNTAIGTGTSNINGNNRGFTVQAAQSGATSAGIEASGFRSGSDGAVAQFIGLNGSTILSLFDIRRAGADNTGRWDIYLNNAGSLTKYGEWSTTGLAVTGAVSGSAPSAGATTFTATSNGVSGINHPLYTFQRSGGAVAGEITYEGVGATMNLWTTTAHNLVLGYNRTAIAAISSTGLAVTGALSATTAGRFGTTSATIHGTESLSALASSGVTVGFACDAAASWPLSLWHKGTGTKDLAVFYSNDGGSFGLRGKIQTDGTGVSLISSSDERLKTNFRPITNSGVIIDALAPYLFDWLSGQKDTYGFGAQSTYQVFPQAVAKGDDNLTEITDQWGMDVSKLVPILVAELKALRQRVAALEAK